MVNMLALLLCRHSSTCDKNLREKVGNWTWVLIILVISARLVAPLPEFRSSIDSRPSRSFLSAFDLCVCFWFKQRRKDLANPNNMFILGRGGSIGRHRRIQAFAPQENLRIWATIIRRMPCLRPRGGNRRGQVRRGWTDSSSSDLNHPPRRELSSCSKRGRSRASDSRPGPIPATGSAIFTFDSALNRPRITAYFTVVFQEEVSAVDSRNQEENLRAM